MNTDKKTGGFGYVCCLKRHTYVQFWKDDNGKEFLEFEGFKSHKVNDLFEKDRHGNILAWQLIGDIEKLLLELYLFKKPIDTATNC